MAKRSQERARARNGVDSSGWDGKPYDRPTPVTFLGINVTFMAIIVTFDHM